MNKQNIRNIIELFISWNDENMPIDVANIDSAVDYIYSCQEPIDGDKLDELAYNEAQCYNIIKNKDWQEGFTAGYRKAKSPT